MGRLMHSQVDGEGLEGRDLTAWHSLCVPSCSQTIPATYLTGVVCAANTTALEGDAILMQLLKDSGYDIDFAALNQPAVMNLGPEVKVPELYFFIFI